MSPRKFFIISILFWGLNASAQQDSLSTKYREDQFYISFGLQLQQENINGFKQNGFSNNFQFGFVRDIPLSATGRTSIGIGLGYAYNRLISKEIRLFFLLKKTKKTVRPFPPLLFPSHSDFVHLHRTKQIFGVYMVD